MFVDIQPHLITFHFHLLVFLCGSLLGGCIARYTPTVCPSVCLLHPVCLSLCPSVRLSHACLLNVSTHHCVDLMLKVNGTELEGRIFHGCSVTHSHFSLSVQLSFYFIQCLHTYIHTYIHTDIHTYIHTYIHIQTYIHTYTHTHTQTDCVNKSGVLQRNKPTNIK